MKDDQERSLSLSSKLHVKKMIERNVLENQQDDVLLNNTTNKRKQPLKHHYLKFFILTKFYLMPMEAQHNSVICYTSRIAVVDGTITARHTHTNGLCLPDYYDWIRKEYYKPQGKDCPVFNDCMNE